MELLTDLIREDEEMVEELEDQGVVEMIVKMTKQTRLDSWMEPKKKPITKPFPNVPGPNADSEVEVGAR